MIKRHGAVLAGVCVLLAALLTGCQKKAASVPENGIQKEDVTAGKSFVEPSDLKAPSANNGSVLADIPDEEKKSADMPEDGSEQGETVLHEMPQETPDETAGQEKAQSEVSENGKIRTEAPENGKAQSEVSENGKTQSEVPEKEKIQDQVSADPKKKAGFGAFRKIFSDMDIPPLDTVGYLESRKEEITKTEYVETEIDENDPNTYEIVEKEQEVPSMYVNHAGDIKYAYRDGIWYEYKYSSGNIVLDTKDEELALRLLNMCGAYDGFEVLSVDCTETEDENHFAQYRYQVRYQKICAMEGAPSEVSNLAAVDLGIVAATMVATTEEMVPVMVEETVGTGEYHYYGWQDLEDGTCYFDENGEKVTGLQVIQGIRHVFDENGVKISKAGVEVSEENGEIDWEQAAAAGIDLAIIRCAYREASEGTLLKDSQAERNLNGARQAGIETGISLFSQAVTEEEALEETELLISMAEEYGIAGPVAITLSYANPEHNGRADGLGKEERTRYMAVCCQRLQEARYMPVLHADEAFLTEGLNMEELSECQLWLTAYGSELTYTGSCEIWQYTDKGTVNGISGYTGLNISYGK